MVIDNDALDAEFRHASIVPAVQSTAVWSDIMNVRYTIASSCDCRNVESDMCICACCPLCLGLA